MRFKDLPVGSTFRFGLENYYPESQQGPWRKISPRRYVKLGSTLSCQIGTVHTQVYEVTV